MIGFLALSVLLQVFQFSTAWRLHIVGGNEAKMHSISSIADLRDKWGHFCGGSLIRTGPKSESDIILTAAHCVDHGLRHEHSFTVRLGSHYTHSEVPGQVHSKSVKSIMHPEYKELWGPAEPYWINDVALLKLESPIQFSDTIQPIRLPTKDDGVPDGTMLVTAGWGYLKEHSSILPASLQEVSIPTTSDESCTESYPGRFDSKQMICAGYPEGGNDSCYGDSGGPLFLNSTDGAILYGIVSWGDGCARPNAPGVYVRVSSYIDWIEQAIDQLG